MRIFTYLVLCVSSLMPLWPALAQQSLLIDSNGDGQVSVLAFGDSITFGVGDGTQPGQVVEEPPVTDGRSGYPERLQSLSSVSVKNVGLPGEQLIDDGVRRLPQAVSSSSADVLLILEGSNDATHRTEDASYQAGLQRVVNVAQALGKVVVLGTIPPACCNHAGREPYFSAYNASIRQVAALNDLRVADIEHAWSTTCQNPTECELLNLPEGLHPNSVGYDVLAQTALASLVGIDIFSPDGAKAIEDQFGLAPGTIVVKPDVQGVVE